MSRFWAQLPICRARVVMLSFRQQNAQKLRRKRRRSKATFVFGRACLSGRRCSVVVVLLKPKTPVRFGFFVELILSNWVLSWFCRSQKRGETVEET